MEIIRTFFWTYAVENTNFWKKRATFRWKKHFGLFLIVLSNMTNVKRQFIRFHKVFQHFCANDKNISLWPKRSIETNLSKNSCFHDDKWFWPIFPRAIECHKHRETMYRDRQAFLAVTLELKGALFRTIRGCWKQKVLKIRQIFHRKKNILALFFTYYRT